MTPSVYRIAPALLPLLLLLLLAACDRTPQTASGDPAAVPERALVFAVYPYDTPTRLVAHFQPLVDYIAARLGRPVEFYIASSYEDHIRRIAGDGADFAYLGPTPYLRAHDGYGAGKAARVQIIAAEDTYFSVIITRADSEIRTLAELRGRTMAFGSHKSFSGHYVPRGMLRKAGVTLADLADFSYLGRHERVALAVLYGDYHAGGVRREIAEQYLAQGSGLRIIAESPPLPPHVIVARPGLDGTTVEAVRRALIEPDAAGRSAIETLQPGRHFIAVDDARYDFARQLVDSLDRDCGCQPLPW
ncbi:phosphate/phosphite/phosphonate ABC transporter substrate-binding protein [Sulfurivermis fontis]|uniref:phosphate/phosphite/phosphonate ABC transporter substrate-binding protein n=1 Tax=Sulfurivermis fontis TaxID=1972068 RepID=UPI000FDA1B6D|nr:phosphate/phosphite/phosphonate ABC transporter substrate-binding protein [Sulfurivermis fontis]